MNTIIQFIKKHCKAIIILAVIVAVICGLVLFWKYQKAKEEKRNQAIINRCENSKWKARTTINEEKQTCQDYLYLKPKAKKSRTGICHDQSSTYYYKTKIYKTFNSIDECLKSGGRRPYN